MSDTAHRTKGSRWTEEQLAWVIERRDAGEMPAEIAGRIGMDEISFRSIMRRHEIYFTHRAYTPRKHDTEIGARFRQAREAAGLSIRQAAEALGMCASTVYKIERNAKCPRASTLQRAARAYQVKARWLEKGDAQAKEDKTWI